MSKAIRVIALVNDTVHPRYGRLRQGDVYEIDPNDFGDQIFRKVVEEDVGANASKKLKRVK